MSTRGRPKGIRAGWLWLVLVGGLSLLNGGVVTGVATGQEAVVQDSLRWSLEACLNRALAVSPEVELSRLKLAGLEARLSEAKAAWWLPKLEWTSYVGPVPEARGTVLAPLDRAGDLSSLGVFVRSKLDILQPLYTFGKLSGAKQAALKGVAAGKAEIDWIEEDAVFRVKQLYYGLLLAKSLHQVVLDGRDDLETARQKAEEMLEEEEGDIDELDLLKIDVASYEIDKNLNRLNKSIGLTRSTLKQWLKIERAVDFDIQEDELQPVAFRLASLDHYLEQAYARRSDVHQLEAAVGVRQALLQVARRAYYPDLFLVGQISYGVAPKRDRQDNPFASDQFNFFRGGAIFGLRQSLNWPILRSKEQQAQAEYLQVLNQREQARMGIALQVEKAYLEVKEAQDNVAKSEQALASARAWLSGAKDNFDLGIGEAKELLDAFGGFFKMKQAYYQAVFALNMAVASLHHATGQQ